MLVRERRGLALEGQESFQMSQESPPRPATGVYIAPPSKSNRYVQNCAIADCPFHKNWTVRHSNATARNTFNVCQRRPFEPWRTVRAPGVDRPQLKDPHKQRQTTSLEQNSQRPADRPPWNFLFHQRRHKSMVHF